MTDRRNNRLSVVVGVAFAAAFAAWLPAPAALAQRGQGGGPGRGGLGGGGGFQGRGNTTGTAVGAGTLSGTVILDGQGTPVRHARVTLTGAEMRGGRSTTTDESGAFVFEALPAGRFTITASKPGFVDMTWGAKRPGRPGTPIDLADGQRLNKLVIALPRGSVLTGAVVDENGDPAPGTEVVAMRAVMRTGEKSLQQAGRAQTDDRGIYRIYQLQPGDYIVCAEPRNMNIGDLRQSISTEIASLVQAAQPGGGGNGMTVITGLLNGQANGANQQLLDRVGQLQQQLTEIEQQQNTAYAPVYYPGTTSATSATTLTLGTGEERAGVDFRLELVPTAHVDGTITSTEGALPQGVQVALVAADQSSSGVPGLGANMTRVGPDGKFVFSNVTPGQYTIQARATIRKQGAAAPNQNGRGGFGGRGGPGGPFGGGNGQILQVLWASADIAMAGQDLPNVVLNLQPGMTVSGNVEFQGGTPPADLTRVRITLATRGLQTFEMGPIPPADVDSSGRFTITGVPPGRYGITASVLAGGAPSGAIGGAAASAQGVSWTAKSATVGGRDALDFPLEVAPSQDISSMTVTFTTRQQQLSGTIQDASGKGTSDYTIIVFASDSAYWTPQARRIVSARPDTSGQFSFGSLPAGDYRLTAVTDVEPGEWYDPAFLSQMVPASIGISIAEGEKKTQDIKLTGGN